METIIICLCIVIVIGAFITAVLLYNFMQLLSTLNKRLVMVIGDILGNIDLSTPKIDSLNSNNHEIQLEDSEEGSGFNPHNYDPFVNESDS